MKNRKMIVRDILLSQLSDEDYASIFQPKPFPNNLFTDNYSEDEEMENALFIEEEEYLEYCIEMSYDPKR